MMLYRIEHDRVDLIGHFVVTACPVFKRNRVIPRNLNFSLAIDQIMSRQKLFDVAEKGVLPRDKIHFQVNIQHIGI